MEKAKRYSTNLNNVSDMELSDEPSIDRLSDLPEGILCHILSFLPTKFSVATSILSKRGRFVWARVPTLDFDSTYHYAEDCFPNIIDTVMALHQVRTLNRFRVDFMDGDDCCSEYQFGAWIAAAISRNVEVIDLVLDPVDPVLLPQCLFTCKTLVDLSLRHCDWIPTKGAVHLPALKKFHIYDCCYYESDESLPHLLSGCPVLEELLIERFPEDDNMVCCNISSPTLKWLTLISHPHTYDTLDSRHRLVINAPAPALKYLRLEDPMSEHMSAGELPSLIKADICIENEKDKGDDVLYCRTVLEFVTRLCNVKYLKLSMVYVKVLDSTFSTWTTRFHNLSKLDVQADWRFISMFLQNASNLEVLIVSRVDNDLKWWMEPLTVPKCLSSHLTTIKIDYFESEESEFEMVRYLLRNAKVLKRMEIHSRWTRMFETMKEKSKAIKLISLFERGSEARVIAFD